VFARIGGGFVIVKSVFWQAHGHTLFAGISALLIFSKWWLCPGSMENP
jgi:hypothetical protein